MLFSFFIFFSLIYHNREVTFQGKRLRYFHFSPLDNKTDGYPFRASNYYVYFAPCTFKISTLSAETTASFILVKLL